VELTDLDKKYEKFTEESIRTGAFGRHTYWWAYAIYQGKLVIDGWYRTEQEANHLAYLKLPCRFEVICLSTRDRARATQAIKHQVLEETGDIDQALKRAKHKI